VAKLKNLNRFNYFAVTALLYLKGFKFEEEINFKIERWYNPQNSKYFNINKKRGLFSKEEILDILFQAEIPVKEFLELI
jgi:hypothetical protein